MGKKEGDGQLFFFGLTSWPMRLEIAIGSLPGLHRLEKAGRPRSGQKEAETSQEAEFRGRGTVPYLHVGTARCVAGLSV